MRRRGAYEGIADASRRLFTRWLPQSGEAIDDRPCMEIYRNTPGDRPVRPVAGHAAGLIGGEGPACGHGIRAGRTCADGRGLRRSAGAAPRLPAT